MEIAVPHVDNVVGASAIAHLAGVGVASAPTLVTTSLVYLTSINVACRV